MDRSPPVTELKSGPGRLDLAFCCVMVLGCLYLCVEILGELARCEHGAEATPGELKPLVQLSIGGASRRPDDEY